MANTHVALHGNNIQNPDIQVLEPRVMLDANLEWLLDSGMDTLEALEAIGRATAGAEAHFNQVQAQIDATLADAFAGTGDIFDTGTNPLDRISAALDAVREGFATGFDATVATYATDLATAINGALDVAYSNPGATPPIDASGVFTAQDVTNIVSLDTFRDGTLSAQLSAHIAGNFTSLPAGTTVADIVAEVETTMAAHLSGGPALAELVRVPLTDISVDGVDVVTFATGGDTSEVDVTITLPDFSTTLGDLATMDVFGGALSDDIAFVATGGTLSFSIDALAEDTGSAREFGIKVSGFSDTPLYTLSGDTSFSDARFNMGLLSTALTSLDTIDFQLGLSGSTPLSFAAMVTADASGFSAGTSSTLADFGIDLLARAVGGTGFEAFSVDESLTLFRLDGVSTIALSSTGTDTKSIATGLDVSAVLRTASGAGLAQAIASAEAVLSVDGSAIADADARAATEAVFTALSALDSTDIQSFVGTIGAALADVFAARVFDVGLPMTEISLKSVFGEIAAEMRDLSTAFVLPASALGISGNTYSFDLENPALAQTGTPLSSAEIAKLRDLDTLSLQVMQTEANGNRRTADISVSLPGMDPAAPDAAFLAAMTLALNNAIASTTMALTATAADGAITFATTDPNRSPTLRITGSSPRVGATGWSDFTLADFGLDSGQIATLATLDPNASDGSVIHQDVVRISSGRTDFAFDAPDFDELSGVTKLRFTIDGGTGPRIVDVTASAATGWTNLAGLAADAHAAFAALDMGISVATEPGRGLKFSLSAGADPVEIAIAPEDLLRAHDLNGVMAWISAQVSSLVPGTSLTLSDNGHLDLNMPSLAASLVFSDSTTAADAGAIALSAQDLALGDISGLDLSAKLDGSVTAGATARAGFDLLGAVADLADNDASNDTFLDDITLGDLTASARVDLAATSITGGLDLGLGAISIDGADNQLRLRADLDASVIAESGGSFGPSATIAEMTEAVAAGGIDALLGRLDLTGGLIIGDDGIARDASGAALSDLAHMRTTDTGTLNSDEIAAMLHLSLGGVSINTGGLDLASTIGINGIDAAIGTLFDPAESFTFTLDAPELNDLLALRSGDILDAFQAISHLLVNIESNLAQHAPFLDADVPLLNFSVLDTVTFAAEFADRLVEMRNDPDFALSEVEAYLNDALGAEVLALAWDAGSSVLSFDLTLEFLKDFQESLPFNLSLVDLFGDSLSGLLGDQLAEFVTNLVDARGDGTLIFDPDLSLRLVFGLDLSTVNTALSALAAGSTALDGLSTVFSPALNAGTAADLRVQWRDVTTGGSRNIDVDLSAAATLADAVAALDDAVSGVVSTASAAYDATTGAITISDSNASLRHTADVTALFGASTAEDTGSGLAITTTSFTEARAFEIVIGDMAVAISLDEDTNRDSAAEFVDALNTALATARILRSAISPTAVAGKTISLAQLVRASDSGGISLSQTNYATANGYDPLTLSVQGSDAAHEIRFAVTDLGASNAARLLGFDDAQSNGAISSETLYAAPTIGKPVIFLDTAQSGLVAEVVAGADESLNLVIALGPLEVAVNNGTALLGNTDGDGPGRLAITVNDIDGVDDDRYDLAHLADIGIDGTAPLDLFEIGADLGLTIDLNFSDSLGFFDPETDGLHYDATLLKSKPGTALSSIVADGLSASFEGDLVVMADPTKSLATDTTGELTLTMPDLEAFFASVDVLAFLNDPRAVLNGLDTLMGGVQSAIDGYLGDQSLPIVGDKLSVASGFFDNFRADVIEPAIAFAEIPGSDGELPTTVDLLTGFINDQMNALLGTSGVEFIQAELVTGGSIDAAYLYGTISLRTELFNEAVDMAFDFGLPGLDFGIEDNSPIRLAADAVINLGFGIDKQGFFLLNDTDDDEVSLNFTVDAPTFEAQMNVLNVLGLDVKITETKGNLALTARLGADLFGDAGADLGRAYDGVTLAKATGETGSRDYENTVYLPQIDQASFASFSFAFDADMLLPITASMAAGDLSIIPTITTDFVFKGGYTTATPGGFVVTELSFDDVTIDATEIYEAVVKPILDPIAPFIEPIADIFSWLNSAPMSYLKDAVITAFPIFGLADTISGIVTFFNQLAQTNGKINVGDFDLIGEADGMADGSSSLSSSSSKDTKRSSAGSVPSFNANPRGLKIDIPLLTNPFSAIDIILGNFDAVDLVTARYTLIDLDFNFDPVGQILDAAGIPGWARGAFGGFQAGISADIDVGFGAGYDLSGIVNFAGSWDPERLLDGVFIDANPGSLISADVDGFFRLNAGIAGINGGLGGHVSLNFNDPNDDGKIRIPELLAVLEASVDNPSSALGYIFEGTAGFNAYLSVWAGINLPWPFPDLRWSTTVFSINESTSFGGFAIPAEVADVKGGTQFLNIGARAGANMTSFDQDGNDALTITGTSVSYAVDGRNVSAFSSGVTSGPLVIPAGEGNNTINLSNLSASVSPTVTYTGAGTDTITLPGSGLHVVFSGGGADTITAAPGASGTYVVFAGEGADTVSIPGGNVIVLADDDFGLRETVLKAYATGGMTDAKLRALLGLTSDGRIDAGAAAKSYDLSGQRVNLATLVAQHTAATQLTASRDVERITLGAGNHVILTGAANDVITVAETATSGEVVIRSGAGDDTIRAAGGTVHIEAGAGKDFITLGGGTNTVYGWGAAAEATGANLDHLLRKDGDDLVIGGSGADTVFGQYGRDILAGAGGNDTLDGGVGNDILVGGVLQISNSAGVVDFSRADAPARLAGNLTLSVADGADGSDTLRGGSGSDVLLGGGGADTLNGGTSADILVGDYGTIGVSGNRIAETFISTGLLSTTSGTDALDGGAGNDILVAGSTQSTAAETLTDTRGNNLVFGDFGKLEGSRIFEAISTYTTLASSTGGSDTITTGAGNDIIFGGEGGDIITAGIGADIIFGDLGILETRTSSFTTIDTGADGADTILTGGAGDKRDIILAGGGDDTITATDAGLTLIADHGTISVNPAALVALRKYQEPTAPLTGEALDADTAQRAIIAGLMKSMVSTDATSAGADTVTVAKGSVQAILGDGADTASLSDGAAWILGDNGAITVTGGTAGTLTLTDTVTDGGADRITSGTGRDMVIGGGGGDTLALGDGNNAALGDGGTLLGTVDGIAPVQVTGIARATDGADTVTTGSGLDRVALGGGGDTANLGAGDNRVLGDSGSITETATTTILTTTAHAGDGADHVTTGAGNDTVALGGGGDTASLGDGANRALGDSGSITQETSVSAPAAPPTPAAGGPAVMALGAATTTVTLASTSAATDGNDTVTTGTGDDRVILGGGDDMATLGAGHNTALGDSGTITIGTGTSVVSARAATDGADTIRATTGDDIVVLGSGADRAELGAGINSVLGDSGTISVTTAETTLTSTTHADDGADTVITTTGRDHVILGGAGDTAMLGDGDNAVLGDGGTISVSSARTQLNSTGTTEDGGDTVTTGTGADRAILGGGNDSAHLGDGDNLAILDSGSLLQAGTLISMGASAADTDGADQMTSGSGNDLAILGTGADRADLGAGNNNAIGDSGMVISSTTGIALSSASDHRDGRDSLTTGAGHDRAILGGENDQAAMGGGHNQAILDSGSITDTGANVVLTATAADTDGADQMTSGAGDDLVILGTGSDTANLGAGMNAALGDSGRMERNATTLDLNSASDARDGGDALTMAGGTDTAILGGGGDTATLGAGLSRVLGDSGRITVTTTTETLQSTGAVTDRADTITGTDGRAMAIGGGGGDTLTFGDGDLAIIGDHGTITRTASSQSISSAHFGNEGNDRVTGGAGAHAAILGAGADTAHLGAGASLVLGDSGSITDQPSGQSLISTSRSDDGADILTAGAGDHAAILGGDADQATLGDGTTRVLGDSGTVTVAADGATALATASTATDAADRLITGTGRDYVALGGGADSATLHDGDTWVLGDSGTVSVAADGATALASASAQTDAGDTLNTGAGIDHAVLGGGGDTARLFAGDSYSLGDSGTITHAASGLLAMTSDAAGTDGNDSLTTGADTDHTILGGGADIALLGDGDNYAIGDSGGITRDAASYRLTAAATTNSGDDAITGGSGRDAFIGGDRNDHLTLGDGHNMALGDSGEIVTAIDGSRMASSATSRAHAHDGDDRLTAGRGNDVAVLGTGADQADLGDGDNRAIGDAGRITTTGATGAETMLSTDTTLGGDDVITTGSGHDMIFGGAAADRLTTHAGRDIVIGDNASLSRFGPGGLHQVAAIAGAPGADDRIESGDGADIVIGGLGDDQILVGHGDDVAAGDEARMQFRSIADVATIEMTEHALGGDDLITAENTLGENILMGQAGADRILGGDSADWLIGDLATLELLDPALFSMYWSAFTRVIEVDYIRPDLGFDDVISGAGGADFALGGFGADVINGGSGQDFLFGDAIHFQRDLTPGDRVFYERIDIATTFAFLEGGYDVLSGDDGPDVSVGHLGADLFVGNTEDDALFSDAFAGHFEVVTPTDAGAPSGVTPKREVITANFPGFGPTDVVSSAQVNQTFNVYYDTAILLDQLAVASAERAAALAEGFAETGAGPAQGGYSDFVAALDFFDQKAVMALLAEAMLFDIDPELLSEELRALYLAFLSNSGQNSDALKLLIFEELSKRVLSSLRPSIDEAPPAAPEQEAA